MSELKQINIEIQKLQEQRAALLKSEVECYQKHLLSFEWCYGKNARLEVNLYSSPYYAKYKLVILTKIPKSPLYTTSTMRAYGTEDGFNYLNSIQYYGYETDRCPYFGTNNSELLAEFIPLLKLSKIEFDRQTFELYKKIENASK